MPRDCIGPRRRTRVLAIALSAFLFPACSVPGFLKVEGPPDGVTVKSLTADISFGEGPTASAGPAAIAPPDVFLFPGLPTLSDLEGLTLSALGRIAPLAACPEPSESTFPEKSAGFVVEGTPEPGTFRWRQEGTIEIIGLAKFAAPALDVRRVRALPPTTDGVHAYEFELVSLAGREIQTIEIRQAGNAQTHGVFLTRFRLITSQATIDFNPPSVLAPKLFSLPVRTEVVSATAVDVVSGLTMTINGSVDASTRARLEGCGEVFDAWAFEGSRVLQSVTDPDQAIRSTTYNTFFAPQHGGIFVGDHVVTNGSFGPIQYQSDVAATLGSLRPLGAS